MACLACTVGGVLKIEYLVGILGIVAEHYRGMPSLAVTLSHDCVGKIQVLLLVRTSMAGSPSSVCREGMSTRVPKFKCETGVAGEWHVNSMCARLPFATHKLRGISKQSPRLESAHGRYLQAL